MQKPKPVMIDTITVHSADSAQPGGRILVSLDVSGRVRRQIKQWLDSGDLQVRATILEEG